MIPTTPPNNSFNRSANSVAFIREACGIIMARRARLIRALGGVNVRQLKGESTCPLKQLR